MKLSLSGRLIEVQYRYCELDLKEFIEFAHSCEYDAVELRPTQITAHTTKKDLKELRRVLDASGIDVSCIMTPGLERLKSYAEFAHILNCNTLKAWVNNIEWIQRASDLLQSLTLRLATQIHTGGPFETIESCINTLEAINRKNFGIFYDAANLFEAGEEYGESSIKRLGNYIFQLSVQNVRPAEPGEPDAGEHQGRYFARCDLGDPRGLDYDSIFRGLVSVGFDDYVTLNEPKPKTGDYRTFACTMAKRLSSLIARYSQSQS